MSYSRLRHSYCRAGRFGQQAAAVARELRKAQNGGERRAEMFTVHFTHSWTLIATLIAQSRPVMAVSKASCTWSSS